MSNKTRCRTCEYAATDARQYPCNKCKEIQHSSLKDTIDFYKKKKESGQ